MSNATKCDRCGACYEYGGMTVGEEYDLCDGCVADFEAWIDAGIHGERVTKTPELLHDTREQLEEIAWEYDASYAEPYEHGAIAEAIIGLLDRQAAIDRKEFETILEGIQECVRNGSR